jgi:hypothetical protein
MRSIILLLLTLTVAHGAVSPDKIEKIRDLLRENKIAEAESAANGISSVL